MARSALAVVDFTGAGVASVVSDAWSLRPFLV